MKTYIYSFITAFLFCCATLNAQVPEDKSQWMHALPKETYICSLTIPGSHDTFTYNLDPLTGYWGKAQTKDIETQFKNGVRAFDLRPGWDSSAGCLVICHGILSCGITFTDALDKIEDLVFGTDEFAVVFVNREGGNVGDNKYIYEVEQNRMVGSSLYVQEFRPDLTLDDVRGRILIINRDDLGACGPTPFGAFAESYPGCGMTYLSVGGMTTSGGTRVCKFYVQDKDHYDRDSDWKKEKADYFDKTADDYFRERDYFTWCSNHTSAYCGHSGATMDYNENADKVNNYVANDYIPNHDRISEKGAWRGLGLVFMDFACETEVRSHNVYGVDLVNKLISVNFH